MIRLVGWDALDRHPRPVEAAVMRHLGELLESHRTELQLEACLDVDRLAISVNDVFTLRILLEITQLGTTVRITGSGADITGYGRGVAAFELSDPDSLDRLDDALRVILGRIARHSH